MNKFVILCLIGVTIIQLASSRVIRDLSHGYQYHPGHSSGGVGFLQPPAIVTSSNSYGPTASGTSYFNAAPSFGTVVSSGTGSGSQYTSTGSQINYDEQAQYTHVHQAPIITKQFYIHSAPEDHDEQQIVRYVNIGRPQQNYRVVFIKAPTSSVSRAKIIANVAPVEDKTAIYVLAKKSNALDVSAEVVTQSPVHHKPEVFFVKYKTPAEAEHAQHVIQAQYDALGGTSQVSDEGVVPVSSVIGSLGGSDAIATSGGHGFVTNTVGGTGGAVVTEEIVGGTNGIGGGGAVNVVTTGDNTQQVYLPAHQK